MTTLTVAMAVVAYILRHMQLKTQMVDGRLLAEAGRGSLTWVCLIFGVLVLVRCIFLKKGTDLAIGSPAVSILTLVAAFLMAMGSASLLRENTVLGLGGLAAAVCWVVVALQRMQKMQPHALCFMLPSLYYAVDLIINFRNWSRDPLIIDYCFELFALICIMCATFHLGGFSLKLGKRRRTAFFCLCGILFSAVSMAGADMMNMMSYLGAALWLLSNLWLLLSEE